MRLTNQVLALSAFLIKIKELPHINDRIKRYNHLELIPLINLILKAQNSAF